MKYIKILFSGWGRNLFPYGPQCNALLENGLFDASYYFEQNPGLVGTEFDLLKDYLLKGFLHGKDPHPLFSTVYYLTEYQGVIPKGENPLIHYFEQGCRQGCNPHPLFDTSYYLSHYPDVAEDGINPLSHYLRFGYKEGRLPHPLFDSQYYLETNPDVAKAGVNPLVHFIRNGFKEGCNPHPLFDTSYYLSHSPDVVADGINPLSHYLRFGYKEGRLPHPLFDSQYYLETNPDVAKAGVNPLVHFIRNGFKEGCNPHPLFDTSYYLSQSPDVVADGANPLSHYLRFGYKVKRSPHPLLILFQNINREKTSRGCHENPLLSFALDGSFQRPNLHPFFNASYYLKQNPESLDSGMHPLIHFLKYNHKTKEDHYLYRKRELPGKIKTIMIFEHKVPQFDQDSGSLRLFCILKILVSSGYRVILWVESKKGNEPYDSVLKKMGVELPYEESDLEDYLWDNGENIDLAIICRKSIASSYFDIVMSMMDAKIVFDTVDLVYLRNERRARLKGELIDESIKNEELCFCRRADEVLVVSPVEKQLLEKEGLKGKVSVVSNIHSLEPGNRSFAERDSLMFIGGFEHPPNVDGIIWFCRSIFPIIVKQLQGVHFTIVGSHPPASIQALASENITVTGYVKDVAPYFGKARVFVSPLRYGAGVKGKIGQSLAFGLPVVSTTIGAEGMHLEDAKSAMIADDEELFARKTIDLYGNQPLWETLSSHGRMIIEQYHTPEVVKKELLKVIDELGLNNGL